MQIKYNLNFTNSGNADDSTYSFIIHPYFGAETSNSISPTSFIALIFLA